MRRIFVCLTGGHWAHSRFPQVYLPHPKQAALSPSVTPAGIEGQPHTSAEGAQRLPGQVPPQSLQPLDIGSTTEGDTDLKAGGQREVEGQ